MKKPIVTVLMSVHNGEPYIKDAINSILNQTYGNFNFLILDNSSTDNSRKIIREFKDSRIKLVELPKNIGLANALNKGLKMIDTPLVARMDADDISNKNRLLLQTQYLIKNPDIVLLGSNCKYINSQNEIIGTWETQTGHLDIINSFHKQNPFAHSSVIFEKNKIIELGCYPDNYTYTQDLALWSNVCLKYKVANLNEYLVKIRHHTNQATSNPKLSNIKVIEELSLITNILRIPSLKISSIVRLYIKYFRIKIFTYIRLLHYSY